MQLVAQIPEDPPEQDFHSCFMYDEPDEAIRAGSAFVRETLRMGRRCVVVGASTTNARIRSRLTESGIDLTRELSAQQLVWIEARESTAGQSVGPASIASISRGIFERATQGRFTGLSLLIQVADLLNQTASDPTATNHVLDTYETVLAALAHAHHASVLCCYARRRFASDTLIQALQAHPALTIDDGMRPNVSFQPRPNVFFQPRNEASTDRLGRMLRITRGASFGNHHWPTTNPEAGLDEPSMYDHLDSFLGRVSDPFMTVERSGEITYLNAAASRFFRDAFGRSGASLIGKNIWEEFPSAVETRFYPAFRRAIDDGVSVSVEEYYPPVDRWIEAHAHLSRDGLSIFFRDITARKRAAEELQAREQFQAVLANLGQWALSSDNLDELLARACDVLRESLDVESVRVLELAHDRRQASIRAGSGWLRPRVGHRTTCELTPEALDARVIATGQPFVIDDWAHLGPNAAPPWLDSFPAKSEVCAPIGTPEKSYGTLGIDSANKRSFSTEEVSFVQAAASLLAVAMDRKQAEDSRFALVDAIEQQRATLDAVMASMSDGLVVLDAAQRVRYCNRRIGELLGIDPEWMIGKNLHDAMAPSKQRLLDSTGAETAFFHAIKRLDECPTFEMTIVTPDPRTLLVTLFPVRDNDGTRLGIAVAIQDVTDTKLLARAAERERIAMDLHDGVIQSLFALTLWLRAHERTLNGDLDQARAVLRESSARIMALIPEIRAYIFDLRTKRDSGQGLSAQLATMAHEIGLDPRLQVNLDLDQSVDSLIGPSVQASVIPIVREAVTNVIRHAMAQRIRISLRQVRTSVILTIEDDGQGFSVRDRSAQTGQGLRNMAERARSLGGRLRLSSKTGRGTRVQLYLPMNLGFRRSGQ